MIPYYRANNKIFKFCLCDSYQGNIFQVSLVMKDLNNTQICINFTDYVLDY